jgi:hypothetical protein
MVYKVVVSWTQVGEFFVEASSIEEAISAVESSDNHLFPISKAGGEYLDDSFVVDKENSELVLNFNPNKVIKLTPSDEE